MKFILDTDDYENIKFVLTEEDKKKTPEALQEEFAQAMSSFFISYCVKNNWDTKAAKASKQEIFTKIDRFIARMLGQGVLEPSSEVVDEEYLEELKAEMARANFSEEEIAHMVELVKEHGSIEKASEYLASLAEQVGEGVNPAERA